MPLFEKVTGGKKDGQVFLGEGGGANLSLGSPTRVGRMY